MVAKSHVPCRSGAPQGVRVGSRSAVAALVRVGPFTFASPAVVWPAAGTGASAATTATAATTTMEVRNRYVISSLLFLLAGLFAQVAVNQLFDELDALELQELDILFQTPVDWHIHLPGPRKY